MLNLNFLMSYISSHISCKVEFDFSDHVVLFLVQYCVPVSFELSYCLSRRVSSLFHRTVQMVNTLTCLLLLMFSFRGIFFTSTYFHTSAEILAGFAIVISFVYFPIMNEKLLGKIFRDWMFYSKSLTCSIIFQLFFINKTHKMFCRYCKYSCARLYDFY